MITTLRSWQVRVDETFFLGGVEKGEILREFRPHIFFDDQMRHLEQAAEAVPSAHVIVAGQQLELLPAASLPARKHATGTQAQAKRAQRTNAQRRNAQRKPATEGSGASPVEPSGMADGRRTPKRSARPVAGPGTAAVREDRPAAARPAPARSGVRR